MKTTISLSAPASQLPPAAEEMYKKFQTGVKKHINPNANFTFETDDDGEQIVVFVAHLTLGFHFAAEALADLNAELAGDEESLAMTQDRMHKTILEFEYEYE